MRRLSLLLAILVGLVTIVVTTRAAAFCRKTTAGGDEAYDAARAGACAGGPDALPLYWKDRCIAFHVVVDPELEKQGKMTLDRANAIVESASTEWNGVSCGGGAEPVAVRIVNAAREACPDGATIVRNEVRFSADAAPPNGLLAATDLTFDAVDGSISIARTRVLDIYGTLDVKAPADVDRRVERVVRHELGHFLGLAHSEKTEAVMYAGYDPSRADGLTPDDVAGLCDVYAADRPIGAGCALAPTRARTAEGGVALSAALLGAFAACAARRRRSWRVTAAAVTALAVIFPGAAHAKNPAKKPKARVAVAHAAPALSPEDEALIHAQPATLGPIAAASLPEAELPPVEAPAAKSAAPAPPSPEPAPPEPARDQPARAPRIAPRTSDLYIGARYRAFALPSALVAPLGVTNKDLLFHAVSMEADFHKRTFSMIPALTFADLSTGDMLVGSGANDLASSLSYVRSNVKTIAASVELRWAAPVSRTISLEIGAELGLAASFGSLVDTWVYESPNGPLSYGGRRFAPCQSVNDGFGCRPQDHGSPTPVRVGNYQEKSFLDGGRFPTVLPWVSLPLVGVRAQLGNDVAARFGVGASLTGIWAGVSLGYAVSKADPRSR